MTNILKKIRKAQMRLRIKKLLFLNKRISIGKTAIIDKTAVLKTPLGGKIQIGEKGRIYDGAMLQTYGGNIIIGDRCSINPYTVIYGHGGIRIGNGVRIATHTVIIPANHHFESKEKYIYKQGVSGKGIVIEDDVWIGANVTILDNVVIRKGTIIAAGAVVNKSTEPYSIIGGVPAKLIKKR